MIKKFMLCSALVASMGLQGVAIGDTLKGYREGFNAGWKQRYSEVGRVAPNTPPPRNPSPRRNGDNSTEYTKGFIDGLMEADRRMGAPIKE